MHAGSAGLFGSRRGLRGGGRQPDGSQQGPTRDGSVCDAFGVWGEKQMYGKTYMGIERATFLFGADGKLVKAWRKVKVPGHAVAVLDAVRAL
jgi:peroxiredoxin Q/BCP